MVHQACFHNKMKKGNPSVMVSIEEQKYCSKVCFKEIESFVKRYEHSSLNWNEDAINPDMNGTESSIAVLLQWWCTEGNWARYRRKGNDGATKLQHCQGIADIINKTVIFPRAAKGVGCKLIKFTRSSSEHTISSIHRLGLVFARRMVFENTKDSSAISEDSTP